MAYNRKSRKRFQAISKTNKSSASCFQEKLLEVFFSVNWLLLFFHLIESFSAPGCFSMSPALQHGFWGLKRPSTDPSSTLTAFCYLLLPCLCHVFHLVLFRFVCWFAMPSYSERYGFEGAFFTLRCFYFRLSIVYLDVSRKISF